MSHVLLFSGGLDSYLAYLALKDNQVNPKLLYVALNHKYQQEELSRAKELADLHEEKLVLVSDIDLGNYEQIDAFIPKRNAYLGLIASMYGEIVWLGIMEGEQSYNDCQFNSLLAFSYGVTKMGGKPFVMDSPFWEKTKAEVIRDLHPRYYNNLRKTVSCHHTHEHDGKECGKCGACFRKWVAFHLNGIATEFVEKPYKTELAIYYKEKALSGEYGEKRSKEILQALKEVE